MEWEPDSFRPVTQTERGWLRDAPQEWVDEQFYAIVTDVVGTPTELVDPEGTLVWHPRTTLWGTTVAHSTGGASCPLRFPGQYFDDETALNYNCFRYYDPATGRYNSNDPLGRETSPNPHVYVHNPICRIDPLELMSCDPTVPVGGPSKPRFVASKQGIIDTASPKLKSQIDDVADSMINNGSPPPGVRQGGLPGKPGIYGNRSGALPQRPEGYYRETDVWPGPGPRGTERLVVGRNGEVWYTPDHYGNFRTVR